MYFLSFIHWMYFNILVQSAIVGDAAKKKGITILILLC